jgi:hypothetical protein
MSSRVIRPFGPDAVTRSRSTPSSRANARIDGLACALLPPTRSGAMAAAVGNCTAVVTGGTAAGTGGAVTGAATGPATAATGVAVGAAIGAAAASIVPMVAPCDTRSPTFTVIWPITPAAGAGMSMVALSDSSVTSGASSATRSPGLTRTSMTGTSAKSPMSGTSILMVLISASLVQVRPRAARPGRRPAAQRLGSACRSVPTQTYSGLGLVTSSP